MRFTSQVLTRKKRTSDVSGPTTPVMWSVHSTICYIIEFTAPRRSICITHDSPSSWGDFFFLPSFDTSSFARIDMHLYPRADAVFKIAPGDNGIIPDATIKILGLATDDIGPRLSITSITLCVISLAVVTTRLYGRACILRMVGREDYCIVVAMVRNELHTIGYPLGWERQFSGY